MDHLQRSRLNLLTSHMLDRGGLLRLDPALIAEQAADQRARFLGIRHMRIAVDLRDPERPAWLTAEEAADRFGQCESRVYLGQEDQTPYFALLLDHDLPEPGDGFSGLRSLARQVSNAQATLLGYAQAMAAWHHRYRFCGRCGGATHFSYLRLAVRPRKGSALIFFPSFLDGRVDHSTLHEALAADDEKWVCQLWIQ